MWLMIAVGVLILLLGIIYMFSKNKRPVDYYTLFIIGISWVGAGIAIGIVSLWTIGLIFMAIGLFNRDKWEMNRKKWKNLNKDEKFLTIVVMIIVGLLVLAGLVLFFINM